MAVSSLFALIDDIASVLDDVALMTKVAAKKTTGVLGDDLALNAEQVSGVKAERELPVVWAVAKGSFRNKLILVPAALLISAFIPWLITPLLMLGGAYLCFEGVEKLVHTFWHTHNDVDEHALEAEVLNDAESDIELAELEQEIKGAIRTDFVLSAEIIVIALGTVQDSVFITQATVVALIAIIMTIGVYGLVAGIVKLDDAGLALIQSTSKHAWGRFKFRLGKALLWFAPALMRSLAVIGTVAMFLVGGSILVHGIPNTHESIHHLEQLLQNTPFIGSIADFLTAPFIYIIVGIITGAIVLALLNLPALFKSNR